MFSAIINYQFKTSELKNVEKLVKQTVKALKPYGNWLGMCIYVLSVKFSLVGGPWKFNVALEKSLKIVAISCMKPVLNFHKLLVPV